MPISPNMGAVLHPRWQIYRSARSRFVPSVEIVPRCAVGCSADLSFPRVAKSGADLGLRPYEALSRSSTELHRPDKLRQSSQRRTGKHVRATSQPFINSRKPRQQSRRSDLASRSMVVNYSAQSRGKPETSRRYIPRPADFRLWQTGSHCL